MLKVATFVTDNCTWNIDKPFVVGISCPPPEQEININYIKNIDNKLWIAIGQAIYIMDPLQLGIEVCNDDDRVRSSNIGIIYAP